MKREVEEGKLLENSTQITYEMEEGDTYEEAIQAAFNDLKSKPSEKFFINVAVEMSDGEYHWYRGNLFDTVYYKNKEFFDMATKTVEKGEGYKNPWAVPFANGPAVQIVLVR